MPPDQVIPLDQMIDLDKKVNPEAEAYVIVKRERGGVYHILSSREEQSPSWFISDTSVLNMVEQGLRITWQPDAFLKFASTLSPAMDDESANQSFEMLLWAFAQAGLSLLDEKTVMSVFGGVIDQARISIIEQRQLYGSVMAEMYGESPDAVFARITPVHQPLAAIQLAHEIAQTQARRAAQAEATRDHALKRADAAEKALGKAQRFKTKMIRKEWDRKAKARKAKPISKKNKRK